MEKTESEIDRIYYSIDTMGLGEMFEMLKLEIEEAKQENDLESMPTLMHEGKKINCEKIMKLAKFGIKICLDIRYILCEAYEPYLQYKKVRIPFYGIKDFQEFMDEIEDRKVLLRRILKRIYKPRDSDVRKMDDE